MIRTLQSKFDDLTPTSLDTLGLLSKPGTYLHSPAFQLPTPEYFTLDFWFRLNPLDPSLDGSLGVLFGKLSPPHTLASASASSGNWALMVGIWGQRWLRVEVMGRWIDVELPRVGVTRETAQVDASGYRHRVSDAWKMLAVTVVRAKEAPATLVKIFFNNDQPITRTI